MSARTLNDKAHPEPRGVPSSAPNRGTGVGETRGGGAGAHPLAPPVASVARTLVRAIRDRIDEVSTAGRHGGDVAAAVRIVLTEVELSPLRWLAEQQARDGRDGRG